MDIQIKGILRIENDMDRKGGRQRVIFYAEPRDLHHAPKSTPDDESVGAAWLSTAQLEEKSHQRPPQGLRGRELLDWAKYIENGGTIYPLAILNSEHATVPSGKAS